MKSTCLFPCFSYASIRIWILFSYISSVASSFILMRSLKYHYEQNVNAAVKSFHAHAKRYLYFSFVSNLYLSMKIFWKYSYNAKILYNLSAKGDNSLWKKFNTASLSARADNLLSGRIDFLPCLKKPQPFISKRIARKCEDCRAHWPTCTHPQSPPAASSSHYTPPRGSSAPVSVYLSSLSTV